MKTGTAGRDGNGFDRLEASVLQFPVLRRWLERARIDRAVAYVLLTRAWQVLAGPVTFFVIARFFSPETQGFYYTFGSLLALQSFVELGFYIVIVNVASHEWAHLRLGPEGRIEGDSERIARLVSLGRMIFKWYAGASLLFVVSVSAIGYAFFSQETHSGVDWQAPWLVLVALTALLLWIQPFNSLLEGCGQVAIVNRFRLAQAVWGNVALWAAAGSGGGLWAAVALAAGKLVPGLYLLVFRYREFFREFFSASIGDRIHWRSEVWPMQWRLALSGAVNYFAFFLFTPVMFHYHGAVVAGQMGMTRMIVNALQMMAMAWVYTRVPRFGTLIAKRRYHELDRDWRRSAMVSLAVIAGGAVVLWLAVFALDVLRLPFAERLLSPLPTGLFLVAAVMAQVTQCQTAYLRAHKQEPILVMSVATSLATGLLVWWLGSRFGPTGAGAGTLGVMVVAVVWETMIWRRCRREWHQA